MGFRINTNIGAATAHMSATMNNRELDNSLSRLSSGLRINKAADDASGLAIANALRAQSSGLGQAIRNANDGISLVQTADGALEESGNILNRLRTLAVQASNDTQNTASRSAIGLEVTKLLTNINAVNSQTKFNGKAVFGSGVSFTFHIGAYANETVVASSLKANRSGLGLTALTLSTRTNAELAIGLLDTAIKTLDAGRAKFGATQNQLESVVRNISVTQVNVSAAESQIRDVDFAAESANFNKRNIMAQSGSYAMSQANTVQQNVLRLLQ